MNYGLCRLIEELESSIDNMEMEGFDPCYDTFWHGVKTFSIDFEDCTAVVECAIDKGYDRDGEENKFKVEVYFAYLQFEQDKIPFNDKDRQKIESSLKL